MTVSDLIPFLQQPGHNPERHVAPGRVPAGRLNLIPPKVAFVGIRMCWHHLVSVHVEQMLEEVDP